MHRYEFQPIKLSTAGVEKVDVIREAFSALLTKLDTVLSAGRPRSETVTLLQTACFWAVRGIAEDSRNHHMDHQDLP